MDYCPNVRRLSGFYLVEKFILVEQIFKTQTNQIAPLFIVAQRIDKDQIVNATRIQFAHDIAPDKPRSAVTTIGFPMVGSNSLLAKPMRIPPTGVGGFFQVQPGTATSMFCCWRRTIVCR